MLPTPVTDSLAALLATLGTQGVHLAPHVAAKLQSSFAGSEEAILECARKLSPEQLAGHAALPDPLPATPAVGRWAASHIGGLGEFERSVLLAAAVCVEDRTELLLKASSGSMSALVDGVLGDCLVFVAGHFSFSDPRVRIWVHGTASAAERVSAHLALNEAYEAEDNPPMALWHYALSRLEGDPDVVEGLLELSRSALRQGNAPWAYAVAREALSHAKGHDCFAAGAAAGRAALASGYVSDAASPLRSALTSPESAIAASALGDYVHAVTLLEGAVPLSVVREYATVERLGARRAAKVLSHAAELQALTGDNHEARELLNRALAAASESGSLLNLGSSFRVLDACGKPTTDKHRTGSHPTGADLDPRSLRGLLIESVALALAGDSESGIALLRTRHTDILSRPSRSMAVPAQTMLAAENPNPLDRAYFAVILALLNTWEGHLGTARRILRSVATTAPLALPFNGLGLVLARRLGVTSIGSGDALDRALATNCTMLGSPAIRTAELTDQAVDAYLNDDTARASALATIVLERETRGKRLVFHVPGLTEFLGELDLNPGSTAGDSHQPPALTPSCFFRETASHEDRASAAISPVEQARIELFLARSNDDPACARRHLLTASVLLEESGALRWAELVRRRVESLPVSADTTPDATPKPGVAPDAVPAATPGTGQSSTDHSDTGQPADGRPGGWSQVLTERELAVAMLVVDGASNRDVAGQLYLSVRTVEVHMGRIFNKLGVRSRLELSVLAHRTGHRGVPTGRIRR